MSRQSLAELEQARFPTGRVLATPNGIQFNGVQKRAAPDVTAGRPCRVVYVGRLSKEKGLDALLAAWREVVKAQSDARLELWGSGPMELELRQLCHGMGIANSVRFLGYVDGVLNDLSEMDVFVLPSSAEGNSNAILEAMAAGLPIVSTRVGGTPMLVGKDGAEFLCLPGDKDTLVANLLKLIKNRELRAKIGVAMRHRVERHFDIHRVAQTYVSAYRFLASGQRERVNEASNPIILEETVCVE
jgi:glycosyltransferase involved in cell wall biosynthesis